MIHLLVDYLPPAPPPFLNAAKILRSRPVMGSADSPHFRLVAGVTALKLWTARVLRSGPCDDRSLKPRPTPPARRHLQRRRP